MGNGDPLWFQILHPNMSMAPPAGGASGATAGQDLAGAAMILSIGSAVSSAINAFYSAESAKYQMKSAAETHKLRRTMSDISSVMAGRRATQALQAGQQQAAQVTAQYGQAARSYEAGAAARGIERSKGTFEQVLASIEMAKETDKYTITANSYRASEAAAMQQVAYETQARMENVSAQNALRSARVAGRSAPIAAFGSLLSDAPATIWNYMASQGISPYVSRQ